MFPVDWVIADKFAADAESKVVDVESVPEVGAFWTSDPKASSRSKNLKDAKTIAWNGPMGVFEFPKFATGTLEIANYLAQLPDAITVIGGGDSARRLKSPVLRTKCRTSQQAAARVSNLWKDALCRVSRHCKTNECKANHPRSVGGLLYSVVNKIIPVCGCISTLL